jgi:peptidoglycan hydrolase-like protein with peptidoglycan-binding domain
VKVPAQLPWQESGLETQHPRSQWLRWGVTGPYRPLPADDLPASLILPMGRHGPAFLAYPNFRAYIEWNSALVYSTTAAYFATRLNGAPQVSPGNGHVEVLTPQQVQDLQRLLVGQRLLTGDADGRIGSATRAAVKQAQIKLGLPADSYPTLELTARLRSGR